MKKYFYANIDKIDFDGVKIFSLNYKNEKKLQEYLSFLLGEKETIEVEITIKKYRNSITQKQMRALHLMFKQLSDSLNEAGADMKAVIRQDVDIQWTPENVKEYLWRPLMKANINKKSTTQLKTNEIDKIFDTLCKVIGERTGVEVKFPSIELLIQQQNEKSL